MKTRRFSILLLTLITAIASRAATPRMSPNWTASSSLWASGEFIYDGAGNIIAIGNDAYVYDDVGRLMRGTAFVPDHDNVQSLAYDRYGNLLQVETVADHPSTDAFPVAAATNHLSTGPCPPQTTCHTAVYDGAGNQTGDVPGAAEYHWDALGSMTRLDLSSRHEEYVYDANDERIAVVSAAGGPQHYTLRGPDNKVLRELTYTSSTSGWSWSRDYVYRDGTLLSEYLDDGNPIPTRHYHVDHLGTPRVITDRNGYRVAIHTYWPFGGEAPGSDTDGERMKFTGHERDSVAGAPGEDLDYMHARYYGALQARFLSVDPEIDWKKAVSQPQSFNRYAYVRNVPIRLTDPNGRCIEDLCILEGLIAGGVMVAESPEGQEIIEEGGAEVAALAEEGAIAAEEVSAEAESLLERLGTKLGDGFKALTKSNYRANLARYTGRNPAGEDAHHVLPKAEEFAENFKRAGLNVHDPRLLTWWNAVQHRATSADWNRQWAQFFASGQRTAKEILEFAIRLSATYGLDFPLK